MAKLDSKIPKYSQLPIKPGAPAHSDWSVFGDDDEVGCLNFLRLAVDEIARKKAEFI